MAWCCRHRVCRDNSACSYWFAESRLNYRCNMTRTHLLFVSDSSAELRKTITDQGPIRLFSAPPIYLLKPRIPIGVATDQLLTRDAIKELNEFLAISCEYDPHNPPCNENEIEHHMESAAIALQLVRPTRYFLTYRLRIEPGPELGPFSVDARLLPLRIFDPYLHYQQNHQISPDDATRATRILPTVLRAMASGPGGSWNHPCGSIHRSLILFCQGYSVNLLDLRQLLWAAGLDSLFASKLDQRKWGAKTISARLQALLGTNYQPYATSTVRVPSHQKARKTNHYLKDIAEHIFWLRNAYMHGGPIPDTNWLTKSGDPLESGYAYQLLECTEILLRETLLRLFEDPSLFAIFLSPIQLDQHFSQFGC